MQIYLFVGIKKTDRLNNIFLPVIIPSVLIYGLYCSKCYCYAKEVLGYALFLIKKGPLIASLFYIVKLYYFVSYFLAYRFQSSVWWVSKLISLP
jgi:hypothetical protein